MTVEKKKVENRVRRSKLVGKGDTIRFSLVRMGTNTMEGVIRDVVDGNIGKEVVIYSEEYKERSPNRPEPGVERIPVKDTFMRILDETGWAVLGIDIPKPKIPKRAALRAIPRKRDPEAERKAAKRKEKKVKLDKRNKRLDGIWNIAETQGYSVQKTNDGKGKVLVRLFKDGTVVDTKRFDEASFTNAMMDDARRTWAAQMEDNTLKSNNLYLQDEQLKELTEEVEEEEVVVEEVEGEVISFGEDEVAAMETIENTCAALDMAMHFLGNPDHALRPEDMEG